MKPLVVVVALVVSACTHRTAATVPLRLAPDPVETIPVRVLLYLPAEFREFVHTGTTQDQTTEVVFGPGATAALTELFAKSFVAIEPREVASELAMMLEIRDDAAGADFDYYAIPSFARTANRNNIWGFGIEVVLRVDFVAVESGRTLSVEGSGTGRTAFNAGGLLQGAGERALTRAVTALREDLAGKRQQFEGEQLHDDLSPDLPARKPT